MRTVNATFVDAQFGEDVWADADDGVWTELEAYPEPADIDALPPLLADSRDWEEAYDQGYTYQDAIRYVLGPEGEILTDGEIDAILGTALGGMSEEDQAEFFKQIGSFFKKALPVVAPIAQAALPILGGVVGSVVPGIGTAIGGAVGGLAGNLVGQAAASVRPGAVARAVPRAAARVVSQAGRAATHVGQAAGHAGQAAAQVGQAVASVAPAPAKLLSFMNDPQLLGALANAALGGMGRAPGGGPDLGQLMSQLAALAQETAGEAHAAYAAESLAAAEGEAESAGLMTERLLEAVAGARGGG